MFKLSKRMFYFIVAVQLFLLLVVGASLRQFIVLSDRINVSDHLLVSVDLLGQTLLNAETGQRGYIITGDTEYLHPFNAAQITMSDQLTELQNATALVDHNHPRVDRVTVLAKEKMAELQNSVSLVRDGAVDKAVAEVKTNHGKEVMDEIRVLLAEIITNQTSRIDKYEASLKFYAFAMLSSMLVICGLGVLFVRRLPPVDGAKYSS